jgi:hypothetical protein
MMDPPASFSSLPPELVSKICHDPTLQKRDLIALRLTSKSQGIHLSASKRFAKRYFTRIPLAYTRYSLQTFVELCRHPIFGSAVRKVELSYTRFLPDLFDEESKTLLDVSRHEKMSLPRHKFLNDIRLLVSRCDEEHDLRTSSDAIRLLTAAFAALSHWQHLELDVTSRESGALGHNRIHHLDTLYGTANWECDILGAVSLLHLAATSSKCVVQRLQIQGPVWENLTDSSTHSFSALAGLPELKLDIWPTGEVDFAQISGLEDMVTKLLHNSVGLDSLHLGTYCADSYHECLHKIFSTMATTRLEKLALTYIDFNQFKPFEKRIETLRELQLYNCEGGESLKEVLLSIQRCFPRLEYFLLSEFSQGRWFWRDVELEGFEVIKIGFDQMIQAEAEISR